MRSPNYRRGALFVVYDEWGGFFDHVRPPRVVDDRASRNLNEDFGQMGFRIPAVAISPYARSKRKRGRYRVDHGTYGFESILKLISYRFGLGYLNKRHRYAANIGHALDWEAPNFQVPGLPDPPEVATAPCGFGGDDVQDSQQAHASDLAALESLAERHRVPCSRPRRTRSSRSPTPCAGRARAAARASARAGSARSGGCAGVRRGGA